MSLKDTTVSEDIDDHADNLYEAVTTMSGQTEMSYETNTQ